MAGYSPLKITGMSAGLVQERENFILPNDAYPVLQNAYVWRERIKRKRAFQLLGRLQRTISANVGNTDGSGNFTTNLIVQLSLGTTATLVPGAFTASIVGQNFTEPVPPNGTLLVNGNPAPAGSFVNWTLGTFGIVTGVPGTPVNITFQYYTGLPVMGIRTRELQNSANDQTVFFDQKYAYTFNSGPNVFQEFIPGTTWNAHNAPISGTDFFWSTNWWVSDLVNFSTANVKLFWVTNNTGQFLATGNADPPRITDGTTWINFFPSSWSQLDSAAPNPNFLMNWLSMLPFRGYMFTFNTWEGTSTATAINYPQRIRWSGIGNPFINFSNGTPQTGSWRYDIPGHGGFLDIPTSEDIVAIGFVRDNLVVYTERSTWQLRYTDQQFQPFIIERVNSELGAQSPFSAVQFDTSLVGIGDKGVVECDSYKSERIDIKIPDLVFSFEGQNSATFRVHGIRDFINRLAYWTFPIESSGGIFPTQRLVYNYENDSWAIFDDSLTTLGTFQSVSDRTWLNTHDPWTKLNFPWVAQLESVPAIVGGNQQGFIEYLNELTTNDPSLYISAITANTTTPTVITSPNHNLQTGMVIQIVGIPSGTPFANLNAGIDPNTGLPFNANNGVFGIIVPPGNTNQFKLMVYNKTSMQFSTDQLDIPPVPPLKYIGGGLVKIRENFSIRSKKFNFMDEGQNIQMGYLDILMSSTEAPNPGAITLNVYLNYDDSTVSNTLTQNAINNGRVPQIPDTFFNSIIPTTQAALNGIGGTKFWQRVYCATRANFLTLEYTFSNAQLAGIEQEQDVQIDAQILWLRKAGRMTQI